ncbi:glycoside hydrolase [Rhypophila sp. PSN 637]
MGWNSYNNYGCNPSEQIMKTNAQGLVTQGLDKLGYIYVSTDCGWNANRRDSSQRLVWNPALFPSGGKALCDYMHGLGLKCGMYSGAGYFQCGSTDQPASLGYEAIDAQSFAAWGADSLKYDNCYSTSKTNMVDYNSAETGSPRRFVNMSSALNSTSRDIIYQVCQWGCGQDLGQWAPPIANSYRISNDITAGWPSIWRITNQVVPYSKYVRPGAFADMDMLMVGLNKLTAEEERFHFGMWAINKSPLMIGMPLSTTGTTTSSSLSILKNKEVIAINQDPLGEAARLLRRYTIEEYDIWAGNLSSNRLVVALANWKNAPQSITLNLGSVLRVASATARDVWKANDLGIISSSYTTSLAAHQLQLLVLSNITLNPMSIPKSTGTYYAATANATISGGSKVTCSNTQCLPATSKVTNITGATSITFPSVRTTSTSKKLLAIDFCNYEVALGSAWSGGTNTRNITIAVNGGPAKRWAFPISGGNWFESGRLHVEVEGFKAGDGNKVVFGAFSGQAAPDLVGFEVLE